MQKKTKTTKMGDTEDEDERKGDVTAQGHRSSVDCRLLATKRKLRVAMEAKGEAAARQAKVFEQKRLHR